MKIRTKIISGFTVMALITVLLGVMGMVSTKKLEGVSGELKKLLVENDSVSKVLNAHYIWRQNLTESVLTGKAFTGSLNPHTCALGLWRDSDEAAKMDDPKLLAMLEQLEKPHDFIHNEANIIVNLIHEGNLREADDYLENAIFPKTTEVISVLTEMQSYYSHLVEAKDEESISIARFTEALNIVVIIAAVIACVFLALYIAGSISKPIAVITGYMKKVSSDGVVTLDDTEKMQFDVLARRRDEIAELSHGTAAFAGAISQLIGDLHGMSDLINNKGDIEATLDNSLYNGEFRNHYIRACPQTHKRRNQGWQPVFNQELRGQPGIRT